MEIKTVGVVGCGLMGSGIAEVAARSGYDVVVHEANQENLDRGLERTKKSLARGVEKTKISQTQADEALQRIKGTLLFDDMAPCDIVVEAIVENMAEKKKVFATLDAICPAHTILSSNTSSLSVTEMAAVTHRTDKVLGVHFMNPVPVMPLVEIVRTVLVSDETVATARSFAESLGKTVVLARDNPGFIVNLLLIPYLLDAIRALEQDVGSKEDIDTAIKLGLNHPMGPLSLSDLIGLDTVMFIADAMYADTKDMRYAAPTLLRRMVAAGQLGRKSGRGFYAY